VLHVGEDIDRRALRWLRQHDEREYSWVDATSFALMRDKRIRSVLAFDGDFTAAGSSSYALTPEDRQIIPCLAGPLNFSGPRRVVLRPAHVEGLDHVGVRQAPVR